MACIFANAGSEGASEARREREGEKASDGDEPANQSYLNLFLDDVRYRKSFCG